jgi:NifU-like protein involved in Fe-S cluster formation
LNLPGKEPYNSLVRQFFVSPVHAGDLQKSYSPVVNAAVSDGAGNLLQLSAGIDDDMLGEIRFRALGCPHLIAAAEHFCQHYEGLRVSTLREFRPEQTILELAVPVWKSGRILLLEDAVRGLWQKISNDGPD